MLIADSTGSGSSSGGDPADNLAQVICLLYTYFSVHVVCISITMAVRFIAGAPLIVAGWPCC
jgi:hypothetical protein